jgi:ABC-type bacteriocin/lantibiotic exporter with double-glycine peptidase domain
MVLNSMTMTMTMPAMSPAGPRDDATGSLVHRLLQSRGRRVALSKVADAVGEGGPPGDAGQALSAAASALAALGMPGRVLRASLQQARAMGPTLAVLPAGATGAAQLVLVPGGPGDCQRADGRPASPCAPDTEVTAIDLRAEPAASRLGPWLWAALGAESPHVLAAVLALALSQGLALLGPAAAWLVTDKALPDGASQLLVLAVLGLVAVAAHSAALGWWRDRVTRSLDQRLRTRANAMVFEALLRTPYARGRHRSTGESLQLLSSAETIAGSALGVGLSPLLGLLGAAVAWAALCALVPGAAWALAAWCAVMFGLSVPLARRTVRWQTATLQARGEQQSLLLELLQGAPALRAAGAEHAGARRWLRRLVDEQTATLGQVRSGLWLDVLLEGSMHATRAAWLAWGGAACVDGRIGLGAFLAGAMLAEQVMRQAIGLCHALMNLAALAPNWQRVNAALAEADGGDRPVAAEAVPHLRSRDVCEKPPTKIDDTVPALQVDGLWFRYGPDAAWAVRDQSLTVPHGALVVLSGASGAGKTTLLRLAAGLLVPQRGTVEVDGRPVRPDGGAVGYLPQDAPLFEGSIASNLRWLAGCPAARILDVARRSGLDDWVRTLPMGYATRVAAGGGSFSGGQRQLIALTAVLASERRLLLLDEPMSQLDRLSRRRLLDSGLFQGRTVVVISHDRNGLGLADADGATVLDLHPAPAGAGEALVA